ncbi:MAG: sugar ABC transporter permease, partial [Burkholderiales bacterium]
MSVDRGKSIFVLPGLIVLVAIILFPLLFTIRVSLSSWDVAQPGLDWIGISNYLRIAEDTRFWESFARLAVMAIGSVALEYLLGFGLALLVWRDVRAGRFFRVLFLIPMMTTPVIMAAIWRTVFHESLGPANDLLHLLGMTSLPWLSEAGLAMTSVIIVEVWQWTPFMFLMLLAGLLSLPREPFLAAAIDGAGQIRTFLRVIYPIIA